MNKLDKRFLPTSIEEGKKYYSQFEQFDVIFITGDPYYDHPLSGMALLTRLLDKKGYRIGIIAQPQSDLDYQICGTPRYLFCITSGLLDSMLANYTPMLKKRENILVPERALMVYTQKVKQLHPGSITVLGGVEATIRRFTHFDYKESQLRRGILNDTKADVLLFGDAERSLLTILSRMKKHHEAQGKDPAIIAITPVNFSEIIDLKSINGAAFRVKKAPKGIRPLPSYEDCVRDKQNFNVLTRIHYLLPDDAFIEQCGLGCIQHNRPSHPLCDEEMDLIYELPFTRQLHPSSKNLSFNQSMVAKLESSVVIGRGCWGSCSFCIIPLVQGKHVARRSQKSILTEIEMLYAKGVQKINDLTLPTINMYGSYCALYNVPETIYSPLIEKEITVHNKKKYCNQQCVGCPQRKLSDDLYSLLEGVEKLQERYAKNNKKEKQKPALELRSAIRHDIILDQKKLFRKIMQFVTRLKIAPEHISDTVLKNMNKANKKAFDDFLKEYMLVNKEQGTHKNLVPYFVAAHPGSTLDDMQLLRRYCEEKDIFVNLTQVFTPTPGTLSTAMYYTGENPVTREKVHVSRSFREKKDQKNILMGFEDTQTQGNQDASNIPEEDDLG